MVAQCTIERMLSPNRPLSGSNRPGTPEALSCVRPLLPRCACGLNCGCVAHLFSFQDSLFPLLIRLPPCPTPCPIALSAPSVTCLFDQKLQNSVLLYYFIFSNKYSCSDWFYSKKNSKVCLRQRLIIRASLHIDRSAKQLVLPNITMIYHYHIFVGKSIKSIVSAGGAGLVLLTRWESA